MARLPPRVAETRPLAVEREEPERTTAALPLRDGPTRVGRERALDPEERPRAVDPLRAEEEERPLDDPRAELPLLFPDAEEALELFVRPRERSSDHATPKLIAKSIAAIATLPVVRRPLFIATPSDRAFPL